jgi:hypothetical protein
MTDSPRVTALIPVYNREKYVGDAIEGRFPSRSQLLPSGGDKVISGPAGPKGPSCANPMHPDLGSSSYSSGISCT